MFAIPVTLAPALWLIAAAGLGIDLAQFRIFGIGIGHLLDFAMLVCLCVEMLRTSRTDGLASANNALSGALAFGFGALVFAWPTIQSVHAAKLIVVLLIDAIASPIMTTAVARRDVTVLK